MSPSPEKPSLNSIMPRDVLASTSFHDILKNSVDNIPDKLFAAWYNSKGKVTHSYTYQQMWEEAGHVAHDLRVKKGLYKGDKIILCYSFGLQFFAAFLGCLRAGIVAVPIYPPDPKNLKKALLKMSMIVKDCSPKLILADATVSKVKMFLDKEIHPLWSVHPKMSRKGVAKLSFDEGSINGQDIAFLQYTSGSTGDPKGVMVPFDALKNNVKSINSAAFRASKRLGLSYKDVVCCFWIPQYHDMGLIGGLISPFAAGWTNHMFSPQTFIQNPLLWVELMSKNQAHYSMAPDFSYSLVAKKFLQKAQKHRQSDPVHKLDLSSIVSLHSGSEPIRKATYDLFTSTFKSYGLRSDWFRACYGMAEMVLFICENKDLKLSKKFDSAGGTSPVAVGRKSEMPEEQIVKIVSPDGMLELSDGQIGEVWISSPSVTGGYYGKPELSKETFQATLGGDGAVNAPNFLRTGDLGFYEDDYLYICGRQKDLIIVNGANHYPQDIEHTVQNSSLAVRPGCVAAFSSNDTNADGEVEVVFEIRAAYECNSATIVRDIQSKIVSDLGLIPARIVAIKERTILKTTSGKIRRRDNRCALHNNEMNIVHDYSFKQDQKRIASRSYNVRYPSVKSHDIESGGDHDLFDEVMTHFFGASYCPQKSWNELGMTSMVSVEVRDALSENFQVDLDPNCFEVLTTPAALKDFVMKTSGTPLEIKNMAPLPEIKSQILPWSLFSCLQALCSAFLVLVFAFSIVPAWFVGKFLANKNVFIAVPALGGEVNISWAWFPVVVPVWMISLSISVIALKWIVIWKYREGIVSIPSLRYLQWWMVDRILEIWEFWVGRLILNTPLINMFYYFAGAKIHWSVSLGSFIREFDLIEIKAMSSIHHPIKCRKFGAWNNHGPSLRLRSISIGRQCKIKGILSLGSEVGEGASIEKLSFLPEGAAVPESSKVIGNPGFVIKQDQEYEDEDVFSENFQHIVIPSQTLFGTPSCIVLGGLKLLWLIFELYLFFATVFFGQYCWLSKLPRDWRYSSVLSWCLLILWFNVVSIGMSVVIKWTLVGKRRPGPAKETLWRKFADWSADWHFKNSFMSLTSLTMHSRMWNIVLMIHGMDIDFVSNVSIQRALPSNMDLVRVRKSFVNINSFEVKNGNSYHRLNIDRASVGYGSHIEAATGSMEVSGTVIPPFHRVTKSIVEVQDDSISFASLQNLSILALMWKEVLMTLCYIAYFGIIFASLIPSYELWTYCLAGAAESVSIWIAVPVLAAALVLQSVMLWLIFAVSEFALIPHTEQGKKSIHFSDTLYKLYQTVAFNVQIFSVPLITIQGSVMYNFFVRTLGGRFEGRAILLNSNKRIYEFSKMIVAADTIVDNAHITGHYFLNGDITIGHSKISGLLHEDTYAANALILDEESGPMRAFVGTFQTPTEESSLELSRNDTSIDRFQSEFD